jgi:hypothetical protein
MAANYERAHTISRPVGADYSQPGVGEYRFAVVNPDEVTDYTDPSQPGLWYGTAGGPPPIAAGNVLVNTDAGGYCPFVLAGKALPGQPIECAWAGRVLVVAGAAVVAGAIVSSDDAGAAVTQAGEAVALGVALDAAAAAGDVFSILFAPVT